MITQPFGIRLLLLSALVLASGCSWEAPATAPGHRDAVRSPVPADTGARAVQFALWQEGAPYRYGGESPTGFDCSGLVHYAYGLAGKSVPRTTQALHAAASPINRSALKPGDLVFFKIDGKMAHVGIYVDNGRFVHAPRTGRTVSIESLDSGFYRSAFLAGGRLP